MLYDLENVYAATHWSIMPGSARMLWCRPSQTMWQYGSSLNTAMFVPRTRSAIAFRSSSVATPPVGLCGELRKIAFACGSVFDERLDVARGRGGSRSPAAAGTYTGSAAAAVDVRHVGRERGLKTSTASPGSRNASQKNCSNGFAPGPTTTFSAVAGMPNSACTVLRDRLAELRQAERRAVVRLARVDGRLARPRWRDAVLGNGLSPICSSMTSLPAALSRRATARTSNAVSAVSRGQRTTRESWAACGGRAG